MKLEKIQLSKSNNKGFKSTRVLKQTVSQLAQNNRYSLTDPNQRYIINSIKELSKGKETNIIKFLTKTAENLKYATNIKLKDSPINDWKTMLIEAAEKVLPFIPTKYKSEYNQKIQQLKADKNLSNVEKDILHLRENLLNLVNIKQIKKETVGGIKDFKRNLDYFIVSSETSLEHKKYVLERLNYLMSDDYKINQQLKNKKSIVAAELINDMAIFTPGHKVPNIKAVNQKQHGICAAISIVRKKVAYEDKPNYIDSILSELDDSDYLTIYDRTKLGSDKKIFLRKVPVDFDTALAKGYRIIDASATQWMQTASQSGYSGNSLVNYTPFDKQNYDINSDSFYNAQFEDEELKNLQTYYQSLVKACSTINNYRASLIKRQVLKKENNVSKKDNIQTMGIIKNKIIEYLSELPNAPKAENLNKIVKNLIDLEKKHSLEINGSDIYSYITNEESSVKKNKIIKFLNDSGIKITQGNISDKIYELLEHYNNLKNLYSNLSANTREISKAESLYEIAAGTRYQFIQGLQNEIPLNYMMKKENIPHKEACIKALADKLIEKISNASGDSDLIIESLSKNTDGTVNNKEDAINLINDIKYRVQEITNTELNYIYDSLNLVDKTEALIRYLEDIQLNLANYKDSNLSDNISKSFGLKNSPDNLLPALEKIKEGLITGLLSYDDIFNKIGNSSQFVFLENTIKNYVNKINSNEGTDIRQSYIQAKNIEEKDFEKFFDNELLQIGNLILNLKDELNIYVDMLKIKDSNGNLIFSADPADIVIKTLENNGTIPTEKSLKELQNHLNRILKDRSSDEFNSRQMKLSDKSLYKFSKNEQYTLSSIEKNLNPISRYLKKQLSYIKQYIKEPLEELKRVIGLDMGEYWVGKEGESGLYDGQDTRILEYLTGRPHYYTENLQEAVEKIKHSPYSGISTSSVYHDKHGWHAQYIADIAPTNIKMPNGKEKEADILFQDNTWGATEHENIWTDSYGLTRTDYSDERGGTLGYVTNNKFRNGNLVERVTGDMVMEKEPEEINSKQYKKLHKDYDSDFKSPQYKGIILDGESPKTKEIATSIYDAIFTPTANLIDTMKTLTKDMTKDEIKNEIYSIKNFKSNWKYASDKIIKTITDKSNPLKINSKEDFDKLPDNDTLKVILEKAAFFENYPSDVMRLQMSEVKNIKELNNYKNTQRQHAIKEFEHSFGKNISILSYLADEMNDKDEEAIDRFLNKYNIKLTDKEFANTFYDFEIKNSAFDGSMKNTIKLLAEHVSNKIKNKISTPEQEIELKELLSKIYSSKLYFNKSDINNKDITHIIKFIDRVFNPSDDNELVRIYKNLQNTTTTEFEENILPKVINEDLNIKNITGYDIYKSIQRHDKEAKTAINNLLYNDDIRRYTVTSKPYNKYDINKLSRNNKVLAKYTFDSAYRSMKDDLSLLKLDKLFDQYKDNNIKKYGAYPAYPKVDYMPDSIIEIINNNFINPVTAEIEQIKSFNDLKEYYKSSNELKQFTKSIKEDYILSDKEYETLNLLLGKICTLSYGDDTQTIVNDASLSAMDIEAGTPFRAYKKYINTIVKFIDNYQKRLPLKTIEKNIEDNKFMISKQTDMLVKIYISKRYQNKFYETLNSYKKSIVKQLKDENDNDLSESLKKQILQELNYYNIAQNPTELLDRYIESLAKDSELNKFSTNIENLLKQLLDCAKLCEIQSTIMEAIDSGIETDVKNAFKSIKIKLKDGTYVTMNEPEIIADNLVHRLILDEKEDTALMLLDKLGLSETYVNYICKDFNFDEIKELVDNAATEFSNYKNFTLVFDKAYKEMIDALDNGERPIKSANNFKKTLSEAAKKYKIDRKHSRIFLNAIDLCKEAWKENKLLQPADVASSIFTKYAADFNQTVSERLDDSNAILNSQDSIMHIVNSVLLKVNSKAYKNRSALNKKYNQLIEYRNKIYENLHAQK